MAESLILEGQAQNALKDTDYDMQWRGLDDFIRLNPGAAHRRRIIRRMLLKAMPNPKSYLDVGCGPGELLLALKNSLPENCEMNGADYSAEVVETNKKKFPKYYFQKLDITTERVSKTFDCITCSEVIEHINVKDRPEVFRNFTSMLNPNGILIMSCPTRKIFGTEIAFGHVHHPTMRELCKLGEDVGLKVEDTVQWGYPFYWNLKKITNVNTEWSMKEFGISKYSPLKKFICKALYWVNYLNWNSSQGCQLFVTFRK